MKADKETKEKLLESAKKEFLEKGYNKASLRKICADADCTTGALYFFFKDKEDLFDSIVRKPFEELSAIVDKHVEDDIELLGKPNAYEQEDGDHDDLVKNLVHHLYANRDAFMLLINKSNGTSYENCIDGLVEEMEQGYRAMAESMIKNIPGAKINDYMVHWLTHLSIESFTHLLDHETDEANAIIYMNSIMDNLVKSWFELILTPTAEDLAKMQAENSDNKTQNK